MSVRVVARVRPSNHNETKRGCGDCVRLLSETEVQVSGDDGECRFTFDSVLGPGSTQQECFECVASPMINDILEGYNATVNMP